MGNKIIGIFLLFVIACNSQHETATVSEKNGVTTIRIDPKTSRDSKLTEFFEDEITYLLLKENDEKDSQIGEIDTIIEYKDEIYILDWWIGKCIQVFDKEGNFKRKIRNYGDGVGMYTELADFQIQRDTIYVLAHPSKIMKYSINGEYINEVKIPVLARRFRFDPKHEQFFIYSGSNAEKLVTSVDHNGSIVDEYFSTHSDVFYGNMGDRVNFYPIDNTFYFTRSYSDTLYQFSNNKFIPLFIYDFGSFGLKHDELLEKQRELDPRSFKSYFDENAGISYSPFGFSNSKYIFSRLSFSDIGIVSIYDKVNKTHDLVNFDIINDIDESFNFYPPIYQLENDRVAVAYRGPTLYNKAVAKKQTMSDDDWKAYQEGKGKDFIEAAFYAKETENYVLMILKTKK
ncbi:6-bladed beta-propeller [Belliella sp. R4-6]|uniref:6-bladed beta-propeller n=1 Tax=Belliella alkalica TaxID=1730871 RepID=A0ABS9V699_9BACT|nr:6-bladed beta-propeller [Belliella alkalica]MCH7411913.1 6-bladed beta-propeller [Belliella alkalica]